MKKLIITTAFILGFGLTTFAGSNGGGLFQRGVSDEEFYGSAYYSQYRDGEGGLMPVLPSHGESGNQDAPLGTGLVLMTAFGVGYFVGKRRKED